MEDEENFFSILKKKTPSINQNCFLKKTLKQRGKKKKRKKQSSSSNSKVKKTCFFPRTKNQQMQQYGQTFFLEIGTNVVQKL